MPDRYMSGRVVTVGLSSADSYRGQELKIRAISLGNGGSGVDFRVRRGRAHFGPCRRLPPR
jgi:hypothetical protein